MPSAMIPSFHLYSPLENETAHPVVQAVFERSPAYFVRITGSPAQPDEAHTLWTKEPAGIRREQKMILLMGDAAHPCGVVDLIWDFPEPGTAFIGLFLLEEAVQRQGVGTRFYAALEQWVRQSHHSILSPIRRLRLAVVDCNPGSETFWQKQGFQFNGESIPFAEGSVVSTARVMEKQLEGARRALPVLFGKRVMVRTLRLQDIPSILAYFRRNQTHLSPWDPIRPRGFVTEAYWQDQLLENVRSFDDERAIRLGIFHLDSNGKRVMIGTLNLSQFARGPFQAAILGYGLDEQYQGQGFMREALELAIDYAFGPLNLHRLMANAMPRNTRSLGLLKRLGFVEEGYARRYLQIAGVWEDHVLTALTNDAWRDASI